MPAVDTAVRARGGCVSNSYGGAEDATILTADAHLNHPGIAITASTGDAGYGVSWPASSPYVTAVGGTTLTNREQRARLDRDRVVRRGQRLLGYEPKPSWQHDTGCAKRTVADVSADADPNYRPWCVRHLQQLQRRKFCDFLISVGAAQGLDGWAQVGGTSLSSPLIASVYALAGNSYVRLVPYANTGSLFDVTSGSNGERRQLYLCTGQPGYDGPTGLGTPNGTGAF